MSQQIRALAVGTLVILVGLAGGLPAQAAFPGQNGKIAFVAGCLDIWTSNQDGTGMQNLTDGPCGGPSAEFPDWSPDGTKIAFSTNSSPYDVFVVTADGATVTNVTNTPCCGSGGPTNGVYEYEPSWSPDGTRIAYWRQTSKDGFGGPPEIWISDADGTNPERVPTSTDMAFYPKWHPNGTRISFHGCMGSLGDTSNCATYIVNVDGTNEQRLPIEDCGDTGFVAERDCLGDWSPDGTKMVFWKTVARPNSDIFVQNIDGTGLTNLTNHPSTDADPSWSPDGSKIAFWSTRDGNAPKIHFMNANGSGVTQVTQGAARQPDWQPIPVNAYPRPKSASRFRASLTTSFKPCTFPDRTHGPPLASSSCAGPQAASDHLTIGTGDSNGLPTRNTGHLLARTVVGAPGGPDDADVSLDFSMSDVFTKALASYGGELRARVLLQITDRDNTPHPGGPGVATTTEIPLELTASCTGVAGPQGGSTCAATTTADTLVPGTVKEGRRAVWQMSRVEVYDGGADGDAQTPSGDTLFATQGVFVP